MRGENERNRRSGRMSRKEEKSEVDGAKKRGKVPEGRGKWKTNQD